jgi:hypothetical protein
MTVISTLETWACQQMDVQLDAAFAEYLSRVEAYFNQTGVWQNGPLLDEINMLHSRQTQLRVVHEELSRLQSECEERLAALNNKPTEVID